MEHLPAVSATTLPSQDQHYQTPSSTSTTGPTAAGFYQNVTDAAIMQVLQDGLSGNGEPLTHLSVPEPEGVHTTPTESAASTDTSTAEDSQAAFSNSAINSLASSLGVNLTNQAAQMLMVGLYTYHNMCMYIPSLFFSLSLPLSLSLSPSLSPSLLSLSLSLSLSLPLSLSLSPSSPSLLSLSLSPSQMLPGAAGTLNALARFPLNAGDMLDEEPLYVNAKQYHRILKRRQSRAKLEAEGRIPKTRQVNCQP